MSGGYRWLSTLEKEEEKRRIRFLFFYILRGPFYEKFTRYFFFFFKKTKNILEITEQLILQNIGSRSTIFVIRLAINLFYHCLEVF